LYECFLIPKAKTDEIPGSNLLENKAVLKVELPAGSSPHFPGKQ